MSFPLTLLQRQFHQRLPTVGIRFLHVHHDPHETEIENDESEDCGGALERGNDGARRLARLVTNVRAHLLCSRSRSSIICSLISKARCASMKARFACQAPLAARSGCPVSSATHTPNSCSIFF